MKKIFYLLGILVLTIAFAGCSKNNPVSPSQVPETGKLTFAMGAEDNIASGQVTITKGGITEVLPITITNHTGTVTFQSVQVGTWQILVRLFDADGAEIYTGTGTALVTLNAMTTVTITVNHNTGTLQIIVDVSELIDNFNNDHSYASTPGQRDAEWWTSNSQVYILAMGNDVGGNNSPCLRVSYNKPTGEEWSLIGAGSLDQPGKCGDFSSAATISLRVYGAVSLLLKFRDQDYNETGDSWILNADDPTGWTKLNYDFSNLDWKQCDPHQIKDVLIFVQPGQTGSGEFCLDDLVLY